MSTLPTFAVDETLFQLLRHADPTDLGELVAVITNGGAGRLTLPKVVREVLLKARDEKLFLDGELRLLVRELQLFGGNSLRNLSRGGGVTYEQIAADVLNHVSGEEVAQGEFVAQVELKVLTAIVSRLWSEADASGKQAIAASLGFSADAVTPGLERVVKAVLKGGAPAVNAALLTDGFKTLSFRRVVDSMTKQVATAKASSSLGIFAAVAARALPITAAATTAGWGAQQMAGEAYRITVPCVARIAAIRQKESMQANAECPASSPTSDSKAIKPSVSESTPGWHIGTTADRPIVSVSILQNAGWKTGARALTSTNAAGIDRLGPILQAIPSLSAAVQQSGSEYVRVVVNGPLAAAADGNGLRGWVRNGEHITEHARFYEDPKLQNLVNSAALFNIASTVVAQKHLADINERLAAIEKDVAAIHGFLKDARLAQVHGAVAYLRQVSAAVLTGAQTPSIRQKLEDFEASLISIQHHLESDLRELGDGITKMKDPGTLGTSAIATKLQALQPRLAELIDQWTLCHAARMAACQLVSAFAGNETVVQARRQALEDGVAMFFGEEGNVEQARNALKARTESMSSIMESKSETYARQLSLERWQTTVLQPALQRMRQQVISTNIQISFQEQAPVVLAFRMDYQGSLEAYHLEHADAKFAG